MVRDLPVRVIGHSSRLISLGLILAMSLASEPSSSSDKVPRSRKEEDRVMVGKEKIHVGWLGYRVHLWVVCVLELFSDQQQCFSIRSPIFRVVRNWFVQLFIGSMESLIFTLLVLGS